MSVTDRDPHSPHVALRDMDDAQFKARYACDRLVASMLINRIRYVNAHMSAKLRANAFSMIIRDMDDFCTTVQGPPEQQWAMPAASLTNPIHWGPVSDAVGLLLEEVGLDSLRPGDVVIANDSYRTGKHLNDVSFIRPLFHEDRLIGAVHVTAHQFDLGSRVPGGFDLLSETIWEDGLLLTPMLLYREGRPVRSTFSLIGANTRAPDVIISDLQVINSTLELGEQLLKEGIRKYGLEAYLGAIRYSCDMAEEAMSQAFERIPDGTYTGMHSIAGNGRPDSENCRIQVSITKHRNQLEFDFSGTTGQVATAMNSSWLDAKTGVIIALKSLLDRDSIPNSGALRNIDFLLPAESLVNAAPPAATMYYFVVVDAISRAIVNALNPVVGEDAVASDTVFGQGWHRAGGRTASGAPWEISTVVGDTGYFCKGATKAGDGDSYGVLAWLNMSVLSYEVMELENPLLILHADAVPDTGGPGYNRGGAGRLAMVQYLNPGMHYHSAIQFPVPAEGAYGGGPGGVGGHCLFVPQAENAIEIGDVTFDTEHLDQVSAFPLGNVGSEDSSSGEKKTRGAPANQEIISGSGALYRHITSGGGGWGNPFERPPHMVLRDVRDGYVSISGAARDYKVAIEGNVSSPETLRVDAKATELLRR